jgi:hypothetical protein
VVVGIAAQIVRAQVALAKSKKNKSNKSNKIKTLTTGCCCCGGGCGGGGCVVGC